MLEESTRRLKASEREKPSMRAPRQQHLRHGHVAVKQTENRHFLRRRLRVAIVATQHHGHIGHADATIAVHETAREELDMAHASTVKPRPEHPLHFVDARGRHVAGCFAIRTSRRGLNVTRENDSIWALPFNDLMNLTLCARGRLNGTHGTDRTAWFATIKRI